MGDSGHGIELIQKGRNGRPDLVVDTDALRRGAATFVRLGEAFGSQAAGFQSRAALGRTAFGSLPQAQEPHGQYDQTLAEAQDVLERIACQTVLIGVGLVESADNYDGADSP